MQGVHTVFEWFENLLETTTFRHKAVFLWIIVEELYVSTCPPFTIKTWLNLEFIYFRSDLGRDAAFYDLKIFDATVAKNFQIALDFYICDVSPPYSGYRP